jgi:hypothetical protein
MGFIPRSPSPAQVTSLVGAFWARRFKANRGVKSNLAMMQKSETQKYPKVKLH